MTSLFGIASYEIKLDLNLMTVSYCYVLELNGHILCRKNQAVIVIITHKILYSLSRDVKTITMYLYLCCSKCCIRFLFFIHTTPRQSRHSVTSMTSRSMLAIGMMNEKSNSGCWASVVLCP